MILFHHRLWINFSESAKGSDSEDDFLRLKTKAKAASDSDSDSDIGTKKSKKPWTLLVHSNIYTSKLGFNFIKWSWIWYFYCTLMWSLFHIVQQQRHQRQQTTCLERPTTSLQIAMQRSLRPQASPWYLSDLSPPLPLLSSTDHWASLIMPSPFFYMSSQISFSQSLSLSLSELIPIIMGHWIIQCFLKSSLCVCVCPGYRGWDGGGACRRGACTWNSHWGRDTQS